MISRQSRLDVDACIIGAGSAGLAALRELSLRGFRVECFERGSNVGGNWRYENDSGTSSAYRSLRCNVSRKRMQYPSFPMPSTYDDFPHHSEMAAYLEAYAAAFRLYPHIRFQTGAERVERDSSGAWRVWLADGSERTCLALVVANGHDWEPSWPELPGDSAVETSHAHDYRDPEPFAGQRVLILGGGQSGCEIACEVSGIASRTLLSVRRGAHVLPRFVLGDPYDDLDRAPFNLLPWPVMRATFAPTVAISSRGRPSDYGLPEPTHRFLEQLPVVSSDLIPALQRGDVTPRPRVERLDGWRVRFADGSEEEVDRIICATGYRMSFPFISGDLIRAQGKVLPLYRRIVAPEAPGLFFVGLVDGPSGMLPIVEAQSAWLADVLQAKIKLPSRERMRVAINTAERRTQKRFPEEPTGSIRCDPHAYRRLLVRDRRSARVLQRGRQIVGHGFARRGQASKISPATSLASSKPGGAAGLRESGR